MTDRRPQRLWRRRGPSCGPYWRRRWRRLWAKPWLSFLVSGLEDVSRLEDVERALNHPPGGADDVEVRLVGSLRVTHVGHFDHRVDVGVFDVAGGIRRWIAGIMLDAKRGSIGLYPAQRDHLRIQRAIEFGGECRHLAAIGSAAGVRGGGMGMGDV